VYTRSISYKLEHDLGNTKLSEIVDIIPDSELFVPTRSVCHFGAEVTQWHNLWHTAIFVPILQISCVYILYS